LAVLPIRVLPDPVLRRKAKKVRKIDASIQKLIDDMIDTMRAAPGVGLAAPQVGESLRVIIVEVPEHELIALINPQIVKRTGERRVDEGCLSVPGYRAELTRSETVTIKGLNREGREVRIKAQELLAEAFEHETDHLNGVLYIDYLESVDELVKLEPEESESDAAGAGT
jgi:peptide deformylase